MELACIKIPSDQNLSYNKKIQDFAIACNSDTYYQLERNANSDSKRVLANIALSKKTEIGCWFYLRQRFPGCVLGKVDFEIRDGANKGWTPDLIMNGSDVHVKSCDMHTHEYVGDYSWTFQKSNVYGTGGRDVLYEDAHIGDLCIFTYMNNWRDSEIHIKFMSRFGRIKRLLRAPKSPKLASLKDCLYFKDVCRQSLVDMYGD